MGSAPLVMANVGAGTPLAVTVKVYAVLNVPFGSAALVKAGAWDVTTVLVNAKVVLRAPTVAATENNPTVLLAVNVGASRYTRRIAPCLNDSNRAAERPRGASCRRRKCDRRAKNGMAAITAPTPREASRTRCQRLHSAGCLIER